MDLPTEIEQIKNRNRRVEEDKAWETSWVRIGALAIITYAVAWLLLSKIGTAHAWLNALIPVCGFVVSTLSLPPLKRAWLRLREYQEKRRSPLM